MFQAANARLTMTESISNWMMVSSLAAHVDACLGIFHIRNLDGEETFHSSRSCSRHRCSIWYVLHFCKRR